MVCHFLIKLLIWAHSGKCWQRFIPVLPFFFLWSLLPAGWLLFRHLSRAALAAVWSLWWPCVTLCGESRGDRQFQGCWGWQPSPGTGWGGWAQCLVNVRNVILQLKNLWLLVWKAPHLEPAAPRDAAKSWKLRNCRLWSIRNSQLLNKQTSSASTEVLLFCITPLFT